MNFLVSEGSFSPWDSWEPLQLFLALLLLAISILHTLSLACYSCVHFYLYARLELQLLVTIFPHKAVLKK